MPGILPWSGPGAKRQGTIAAISCINKRQFPTAQEFWLGED
jgi:hypothetical protein